MAAMASIIAMRPLPAWTLFALGISLPVAMLELAAEETAKAWTDKAREHMVEERARVAAEVHVAFDQAHDDGSKTLEGISATTSDRDVLSKLEHGNPFAIGFMFNVKTGEITFTEPGPPRLIKENKELRDDTSLIKLARNESFVAPGEMMSFNLHSGAYVTAREVRPDLTVGWLIDDESIQHGAAPHLPNNFLIEKAPLEGEAVVERGINIGIQLSAGDPRASDAGAENAERIQKAKKAARNVTSERLTHFTLAEFPTTFRVAIKPGDAEALDGLLNTFKNSAFGMVSACLFALVMFSVSLFWRARGAQQLADLRTDFVAAVSHELRTPLASVRMFAELLEAGEVAEDERPEVEQALAGETRRLNATLDRMLRFGALSRGKLAPQKSKQKVAPILAEAVARASNAKLEVDPELEANIDGGLVGLALDNLLSNAKKYAPDGGPYLVRACGEKRRIVIDVTDKGPGLGWRARRLIWKPFERADARLSKATEGSGVGLALVRGIAEAHGGKATVTSKPGQGSTFTLRLPRV